MRDPQLVAHTVRPENVAKSRTPFGVAVCRFKQVTSW